MYHQNYGELPLNTRLAQKMKKHILLYSSLVLLSLAWLLLGHGLITCSPYQLYVVGTYYVAGICLVCTVPNIVIMLIHLRRISIGNYDLRLSNERIERIHHRGLTQISQKQWSINSIAQLCISRSTLGQEQALETGGGALLSLFKDEHYYTVYLIDTHHQEHWLLTSSNREQMCKTYQDLKYLLPSICSHDFLDTSTHILHPPRWLSVYCKTYTKMYGRALRLYFAGFLLTGMSLMFGIFTYSTYVNGTASGVWIRGIGTLHSKKILTEEIDGKEVQQIHATVEYTSPKQVISKDVELSEDDLKELGIRLSDTPSELVIYWQKNHLEKLRLSPPYPTSTPYYLALLSLVLLLSQVIPLSKLKTYTSES